MLKMKDCMQIESDNTPLIQTPSDFLFEIGTQLKMVSSHDEDLSNVIISRLLTAEPLTHCVSLAKDDIAAICRDRATIRMAELDR